MKLSVIITQLALAISHATAQVMSTPEIPLTQARSTSHPHRRQQTNNSSGSSGWPFAPFSTRGRDIVDSRGEALTLAGVNWPMSGETMIPEGLEFQSAEEILDRIASVGFNVIRFGYATQMVDEIYERDGEDVPLQVALASLGHANGSRITHEILKHNPGWTTQTTRFELWGDILDAAAERGIYAIPDVHVHKAQWCCSHIDGNAWFGDVHFDVENWKRGLSYVAGWAKAHPNVLGLSLRNELRESWNRTDLYYNWQTLVGNMTAGADAIHAANPDLLITWSGMQYDQDLSALTAGRNLLSAPCYRCTAIRDAGRRQPQVFDLDAHPWSDKLVWELHMYHMSEDQDTGDCDVIEANLYRNGFNALGIDAPAACANETIGLDCEKAVRLTPVIFSEFGYEQNVTTLPNDVLQKCLRGFNTKHKVSWMTWSIAGSYRSRQGRQGFEDTWGLTNYDFSGWRDEELVERWWKPYVADMKPTKKGE
ncbi:hypothetical protein MCOR27_005064 [Pyricularia oryzae]|nr:hypothetical protein MCOR01_005621 [Pyricularia oryzae]KAH9434830.1 hypothetical protein MCOR02_003793 [Pyricularia oryzae]KAI6253759.1 hypothetical protein MCOR19_009690 [Pyricularia oryzae]KAI6268855.1 hypothetical protein MCOR26_008990 [Pyricularia oryzae]KAI6279600.1 hypothetical protein MCOR27_005064 [Pyricularia oryzae]